MTVVNKNFQEYTGAMREKRKPLPEIPPVRYAPDTASDVESVGWVQVIRGVRCKINEKNGFAIMEVGFESDPEKDNPEYIAAMANQMDGIDGPEFRRYFMRDWKIRAGKSVFGEMAVAPEGTMPDPFTHHVIVPMTPVPPWWSRRRGLDPGEVQPFAVGFWAKSPEGIVFLYDEEYIRNAYALRIETPVGMVSGTNAVKYYIHLKSRGQSFEASYVDPQVNARKLRAGFGDETPRTNMLDDLRAIPYPVDCEIAHRSSVESIDVNRLRAALFERRYHEALTQETLDLLGIPYNPKGYHLFAGYFFSNCKAHIGEFRSLKWVEAKDDDLNPKEIIQDRDNHTFDEAKYALLSTPWTPVRVPPEQYSIDDPAGARLTRARKDYENAVRQRNEGLRGPKFMESE